MSFKHQVELRSPSLFKKKRNNQDNPPEVVTKVFVEDSVKEVPLQVVVGVTLTVGLTTGYLVGHMRGVSRGGNTYIINK